MITIKDIGLIILATALVVCFIALSIFKSKLDISKANLEIAKTQNIIAKQSLTTANAEIEKNNEAVKILEAQLIFSQKRAETQTKNIEEKYAELLAKTKIALQDNNSCETQLTIINNNQKQFLTEKDL